MLLYLQDYPGHVKSRKHCYYGTLAGIYENGVKSQKHKMCKIKTRVLLFYAIYLCVILF